MTVTLNWISSSFLLVCSISLLSPMTSLSWLWRCSVNSLQFSLTPARSLVMLKSSKSFSWNEQTSQKSDQNISVKTYINNQVCPGTEDDDDEEKDRMMESVGSHHRYCWLLGWWLPSAATMFSPTEEWNLSAQIQAKFAWSLCEGFIGQFTCKIW